MSDVKPDKASKLRALQQRFIKELPDRLDVIEQQWRTVNVADAKNDFLRLVHSLAGSAGTFGFFRLGDQAREIEMMIPQLSGSSADAGSNEAIEQGLLKLQELAAQGPEKVVQASKSSVDSESTSDNRQALIYVLEDDISLAEDTARQLQHFGYRAEVFHSADALHAAVARQVPDALLADVHLPEGEDAGPQAAADLRKGATQEIPVIFISGLDSWKDRLNAVRAGGQSYLSKPINFSLLLDELEAVIGYEHEAHYRILVVEDTVLLAEHYAAVLETAGMQTEILNDPAKILDVLAVYRPDLILMDIYMPGCTGVEAAQVIRQHPAYTNLPIVYLSTEKALEQQLEALRVGGDDFLQKPISDTHLVTAVRIRARRFRELTALMNRDSLTGLLNHINLKLSLEREVSQAQRRCSPLSFVMLDIDLFKSVNDTYGHPVGDRVIKSLAHLLSKRLRKGDIAARYGGEEFAVILPDTRVEDAYTLIDDLRKQFAAISYAHDSEEFSVTFSAGIASCPPNTEMEGLIAAADNALYKAKNAGRNQVSMETDESG